MAKTTYIHTYIHTGLHMFRLRVSNKRLESRRLEELHLLRAGLFVISICTVPNIS